MALTGLHDEPLGPPSGLVESVDALAGSLWESWHEDRGAVRDLVEQVTALYSAAGACRDEVGLAGLLARLRWWAVSFLNGLGDSAAQAIAIAETLLTDQERLLGPDHPDTLASRNNLALAYQETGRTAEAIALHEQTLATRERLLGPDHPDTLTSRNNLAIAYRDAGGTDEIKTL